MTSLPTSLTKQFAYKPIKSIYTRYLRELIAERLGDVPADGSGPFSSPSLLTRQRLYEAPPNYMEALYQFDEPEQITIDPPKGVGTVPEDLQRVSRTWEFFRPFVLVLNNIELLGPNALAITPDNSYVIEATDGSAQRVTDALVRALGRGLVPYHQDTDPTYHCAVSFAGPWSREYFHWFADYLPRLRLLHKYNEQTGESPAIIIPGNPPRWLSESLDLLGIKHSRRIEWDGGRISVKKLIIPSLPRHTGPSAPPVGYIHSPRELGWLRDRMLDAISDDVGFSQRERLYISRSKQPSRRIVNENELLAVASSHGFQIVHPEKWSLSEQISRFSKSEAVLGPHGAGLINAIYGIDTRLIELFGRRTNPCFFAISRGMNIPYSMMHCEPRGDDMHVNPDRLDELLSLSVG